MKREIIPELIASDAIILGTPVYFDNVSSQMKHFMDRTYCLIGYLKNKIGGSVVVGRKYGLASATTAINSYFLKHEMIPANRGVTTLAFGIGETEKDIKAIDAVKRLLTRVVDLEKLLGYS